MNSPMEGAPSQRICRCLLGQPCVHGQGGDLSAAANPPGSLPLPEVVRLLPSSDGFLPPALPHPTPPPGPSGAGASEAPPARSLFGCPIPAAPVAARAGAPSSQHPPTWRKSTCNPVALSRRLGYRPILAGFAPAAPASPQPAALARSAANTTPRLLWPRGRNGPGTPMWRPTLR